MEKKNIQNEFLDKLQAERQQVTVFTINGFQLKGTIAGWDQFTVMVERADHQSLVFKSAISTIAKEG